MSPKSNFCSQCPAPIKEADHFCPNCGHEVVNTSKSHNFDTTDEEITTPISPKNKKKSKFRPWLIIPLITIISFAAYVLFVTYQTRGDLLPRVSAVSFSPTNNKLVSAGSDNHLEIWDTTQGMSIKRKKFATSYGIHRALAWSPNNQIIALARVNPEPIDNEIILFDANNLKQLSTLSTGPNVPIALCIDPDGNTLYSVTYRLGIGVWDLKEGKKLGGLENLPYRLVTSASFDSNCQKIITVEGITETKDGFSTTDDKLVVYQRINMDTLFDTSIDGLKTKNIIVRHGSDEESIKILDPYSKKFQSLNIYTYALQEDILGNQGIAYSFAMGNKDQIVIGNNKGLIEVFNSAGKPQYTLHHGPVIGTLLAPILEYFD